MFGFGQSSRRIAIDQLKTQYPNTRELTKNNDFEVPFSVGGYFYNVIVQLGPSFPGSAPGILINFLKRLRI